ncbi:DUF881 domain-containing protein [Clostridium sp.]|uniref:DUF881 domain-containing protein n=1 Tax=Clostridium sp. TaxID=1506 RepID=UPI003216B26F
MRVNEANIFLFIATIIIGILISMNVNLNGETKFLDLQQYQKAYDKRTKLQTEISNLENEYSEINRKIYKYETGSKTHNQVMSEIVTELNANRLILGLTPVVGNGVKITLNDAPEVMLGGDYLSSMLVHDRDIVKVINDLRNAGAEAISINGYRVVQSSSGRCAGATIDIDGIKLIAPFYITAIGNKDVIETFISNEENHIKTLKARKCYVEIESVYDEILPAYSGNLQCDFLNTKEK